MTARKYREARAIRGNIPITDRMEMLQVGYLHAVAAAAGCSLSPVNPDRHGIDWSITHGSARHIYEDQEATLKVQLKSTTQLSLPAAAKSFPFILDNLQLSRLAYQNPTIYRILVVMLVPKQVDDWINVDHSRSELRYCNYWVNLAGQPVTGESKTTVRVPVSQIFDDVALTAIMGRIGAGGRP